MRYRGLRNETNIKGDRKYRKRSETDLIRGVHEPLISQELFDKCIALRQSRNRGGGHPMTPTRVYLFKDIAQCSCCGQRMTCNSSRHGLERYTCRSSMRLIDCTHSDVSVLESHLIGQADELIKSLTLPDAIMTRAAELAESEDAKESMQRKRDDVATEMKRLDVMFEMGRKSEPEYRKGMDALRGKLALLQPLDAESVLKAGTNLASLLDVWRASENDRRTRHEILRILLSGVRIDASEKKVVRWTPQPEFEAIFKAAGHHI